MGPRPARDALGMPTKPKYLQDMVASRVVHEQARPPVRAGSAVQAQRVDPGVHLPTSPPPTHTPRHLRNAPGVLRGAPQATACRRSARPRAAAHEELFISAAAHRVCACGGACRKASQLNDPPASGSAAVRAGPGASYKQAGCSLPAAYQSGGNFSADRCVPHGVREPDCVCHSPFTCGDSRKRKHVEHGATRWPQPRSQAGVCEPAAGGALPPASRRGAVAPRTSPSGTACVSMMRSPPSELLLSRLTYHVAGCGLSKWFSSQVCPPLVWNDGKSGLML